jgi:hypothetical protein
LRPVQSFDFDRREAKEKIFGETLGVALDLFVDAFGAHPIEGGELGVQQHFVAAKDEDGAGDVLDRHKGGSGTEC